MGCDSLVPSSPHPGALGIPQAPQTGDLGSPVLAQAWALSVSSPHGSWEMSFPSSSLNLHTPLTPITTKASLLLTWSPWTHR